MEKIEKKKKKKDYVYAAGKRKSSSARIRIFRGKGESTVNGKPITDYFPGAINKNYWLKPFRAIDALDKYYVTVKVMGGGQKGQLDAVVHGIAKALAKMDTDKYRPSLKKLGLLTRDSRERLRRNVGTGGKARRKKQSPKR